MINWDGVETDAAEGTNMPRIVGVNEKGLVAPLATWLLKPLRKEFDDGLLSKAFEYFVKDENHKYSMIVTFERM